MKNKDYVSQLITPRVSTRFLSKIVVPAGGLNPGCVVVADTLDNTINGNYEVWKATQPAASNLDSKFMAIVLNDGFETLEDGRRPAGQPNYYKYTFEAGEVAPVAFIGSHLLYNISMDCIKDSTKNLINVDNYLIPTAGDYLLSASQTLPNDVFFGFKILTLYNTPKGGEFAGEFVSSMICTPIVNTLDEDNLITSFNVANQVGETVIDQVNNTISLSIAKETLTDITPTFSISKGASITVNGVTQISGETSNDFSNPVSYVVANAEGEARTYTVTITKATYALTFANDEHSTITVTSGGESVQPGENVITFGDTLVITASAESGYALSEITVNGALFTSGNNYVVSGNVLISSSTIKSYSLSIEQTNATVVVASDEGSAVETGMTLYEGEVLTITATPAENYTSVDLKVNNESFVSGNTITVTANVAIVAIGVE